MGNWESHLYEQPAQKLGEFIHNNLRPFEDCQKQIDQTVDTICAVLQKAEQSPLVTSVAKGGSYGRKTVLRGKSDGTLVIFFSGLEQFQDQKKSQHKLLSQIWAQLKQCEVTRQQLAAKMEIQTINDRLFILLSTKQQTITFEMLPAFNALGLSEKPSLCTYRELERSLNMRKASPGEFSVCFTELQEKFFSNHPSKLRDLILLVKYWCLQCQKEQTSLSLLPLYALELLTVYAWEQGCGAEDFDIAEGLRTVLGLIEKQEQLCVYWMVNYNFEYDAIRNILLGHLRSPRLNESPGPSWNVLPTSLYVTPSHLLDKFIKDFLQPDKTFLDQIKKAVDVICKFLKENCFRHSTTKIQKIVKGGSTAKGTALKSGSDANLVVFTDSLKSYTSQKSESWSIIKEIHKQLEACQQEKDFEVKFEISKGKVPWVLSFTLKSKVLNESVDFNILPAFNALGELKSSSTPSPRIYVDLINLNKSSDALGGEFSTCFTELQCKFVRSQPTKLKDLIRLVKHWYKWCESKLKQKGSLPPKYALELLTIYAWEQGSRAQDFDTAEGFRAVLELVTKYQQLCVFWKVNYDYEDVTVRNFLLTQIQRTRPVILDPADPTGDVGGGDCWCWHLLAKEATEWLSSVCFKDGLGYPTQVWNVPVSVL